MLWSRLATLRCPVSSRFSFLGSYCSLRVSMDEIIEYLGELDSRVSAGKITKLCFHVE
jgi:hypothetical protein